MGSGPVNDETIRLVLEMTGTASIEDATRALQAHKTKLDEVSKSYEVTAVKVAELRTTEEFEMDLAVRSAMEKTQAQNAVRRSLEESEKTVVTTTHAHGDLGRGILQTSYAVQDFTSVLSGGGGLSRALGSVQNNIPVLLTGLGVGAGLAGVISVVSVALGAAIPLLSSFADGEDKAADATKKHADEAQRLRGLLTTEQDKIKKSVDAYLKDAPAGAVEQGLQASILKDLISKAEPQAVLEGLGGSARRETPLEIRERLRGRADEEGSAIFARLATDPTARQAASAYARANPGNFQAGFGAAMTSASAGTLQTPEEAEKEHVKGMDAERKIETEIEAGKKKQNDEIRKRAEGKQKDAEKAQREKQEAQDRIDQTYIDDEQINERETNREQLANMQGAREQAAADQRAAAQRERDADPLNQLHKQQEDAHRRAAAEAMRQNQNWGANADELGEVARTAAGLGGGDVAAAVERAFQILAMKVREENMRAAQRINQQAQQFQNMPNFSERFGH